MKFKLPAALSVLMSIAGCSNQDISSYADKKPTMDLRKYLNGKIEADGVLFDYAGRQDRRFHVDMVGTWNGNEGTLQESYIFDDGQTQQRSMRIQVQDDHHFTATAADITGTGQGLQNGNALNMRYVLQVPRGDSTIEVSMDDWIYLLDEHTAINKTSMHKFGLKVGELVMVFRKK